MDWTFIIALFICLLHNCGPSLVGEHNSVTNVQSVGNDSNVNSHRHNAGLTSTVKPSKHHIRSSLLKRFHNSQLVHGSPIGESVNKNNGRHTRNPIFPEPWINKLRRTVDISSAVKHLSEETQFLHKSTTTSTTTALPTPSPTPTCADRMKSLNTELELVSKLNNEEDELLSKVQKFMKKIENPKETKRHSRKQRDTSNVDLTASNPPKSNKDGQRQKRALRSHSSSIPVYSFYDNLEREKTGRRYNNILPNIDDPAADTQVEERDLSNDGEVKSKSQNSELNEMEIWAQREMSKRNQNSMLTDDIKNVQDSDLRSSRDIRRRNGRSRLQEYSNDNDDDDDYEDDDDDDYVNPSRYDYDVVDDFATFDDDIPFEQDSVVLTQKRNISKEDQDKAVLETLSASTQFLHKQKSSQPPTPAPTKKTEKKIKELGRIDNLMAKLKMMKENMARVETSGSKTKKEDEKKKETKKVLRFPERKKMVFTGNVPQDSSSITPASSESGIIANAVLWIGVGVGTAFSAIMFILCCSFYRCLFYYRSHLSPPLKSFLESYEEKSSKRSKKVSPPTDDDTQYVISISEKNEDELNWSSEEEEVFDINTVKKPPGGNPEKVRDLHY